MTNKPQLNAESSTPGDPGRLGVDDRGNVTWQWADDDALRANDSVGQLERMRALDPPGLRIQDDAAVVRAKVRLPPKGPERGYSPYNSGLLNRTEPPKKKDIRALSEWIKLRRKVAKNAVG
jgi:hypothetical protein